VNLARIARRARFPVNLRVEAATVELQAHRGGAQPPERGAALLRIHLLGRFEVVRADAPIPPHAWRRRRPADLLKLVALSDGRTISRDAAIDALWPDKDPASGANNLHRALYDLRQILGGRWVDIDRGNISLRPDAWVDVDAFEQAVRTGGRENLALAVSLYRGELSPEDRESPWLAPRRALLRGRFAEAAAPLARDAAASGDAAAGVPLLRRLLEVEPATEDAHRMLMRLLAESGRRADALRQYDSCEVALRAAGLGPPSPEIRGLRDAIQRGEVGPAHSRPGLDGARRGARRLLGTTDPPTIRGRAAALLLFESLVEQGAGALVLLGEAGVGKTRLAIEGARIAQARGAAVVCGLAGALPATPYALLADALREEARAGTVADPFAETLPRPEASHEERRRIAFESVRRALESLAAGRPLFLLLDEIHLADESSLNLVHFLAQQAKALRLMMVCTCREDAIHAGTPIQMALAHLDCERLARGVRVPRIGLGATREQIADLLASDAPEPVVAQVYRVTDGCPALTEEVVRAWRESGQAVVPSDPAAAIRGRVARLGPRAEALLAAAAACGTRFDFDVVRAASGLSGHDAMAALEVSLEARLLDEDGRGHHFHHALAREAIYLALSPERRRSLHAAVADVLEARGTTPDAEPASDAIAWHRREAGQPERAVRPLIAAGHRAAERAGLAEATACFTEALHLLDRSGVPSGAERFEILDALGRVQLGLGELSGAVRSFGAAARLEANGFRASAEERARSRRLGALALVAGGHLRLAAAEVDAGLAEAESGSPEDVPALLHLRAQVLWHEGRDREAVETAESCAEAASRTGNADLFARGRDLAALARATAGKPLAAPDDSTGPADRRRQDAAPEHPFDVHLILWERDLLADRTREEVERAAAALLSRARDRAAADAVASSVYARGALALAAGRFDLAEAALREALEAFRAVGSALGEALTLERLGTLATVSGRLEAGMDLVTEGVVAAERGLLRRHALTRLHAAEARNRLAAGALYAAEDAIREASETAARHGDCVVCDASFRPELVRVALARGRIAEAEAEVGQLEDLARQRGGRGVHAVARLARGRVLAVQGRAGDALAAFAAAATAFRAAGLDYDAARCLRLATRLGAPAAEPPLAEVAALLLVDADA
jgi:DNA-binding SARP family transcriptional activator/tetratricopeptide (TPR) repeat protein